MGAAALSLLRQVGAGALDTVYAEDGTVFLADAYRESTWDAVATPYAGYLHVVPRILAEIVSILPVSAAATGLAVSAALVTGLLALLVYHASGTSLTSPWARALAAAVVVLVPVGQEEIPNSIANLHWPMLYALFWVLLWEPAA
ncbi:MAG TPA: glucosyltransferase, partial [Myxococcota bacterium]|nr:glucosyltransferase [Myxococcota bacterium]